MELWHGVCEVGFNPRLRESVRFENDMWTVAISGYGKVSRDKIVNEEIKKKWDAQ